MEIHVGNLPFETNSEELAALFEAHGRVERVHIPADRETGRPRGFGFVTMPVAAQAKAAVEALDGSSLGGRALRVNEARGGNRPRRA